MSEHVLGGYVYARPPLEDCVERVVSDVQAQIEIDDFSKRVSASVVSDAPDKWTPYFENDHLKHSSLVALDGLRTAVERLSSNPSPSLPIAIIERGQDGGHTAIVGDLVQSRGLESRQRKNDRGVTSNSLVLFFTKKYHSLIFGDEAGLNDIDDNSMPIEQEIPVDWFDYLPHIDGSGNYTVRHGGYRKIAIGTSTEPLLRNHGLQHLWEHYHRSSDSHARVLR